MSVTMGLLLDSQVLEQANFLGWEGVLPEFPQIARKIFVRLILPAKFLSQRSR